MSETPFLSFYTPHFNRADGAPARPLALERCARSVQAQTIPCEHVFALDDVPGGSGVAGMFGQVCQHAHRLSGDYVHFLADDDYLPANHLAAQVQRVAEQHGTPDVIIVSALKQIDGRFLQLPTHCGPPEMGHIDLGCVITRRDVWLAHVKDYPSVYEADYHHVRAMWDAGRRFYFATDILFDVGQAMRGAAEAVVP